MTNEELMGAALEQASLGLDEGELPIGSVVVADGEIVVRAFGHSRNGLLGHPELRTLQEANRRDVSDRLPAVVSGVRWEESAQLMREFLKRKTGTPFARRWAETLAV